MPDILCKSPNHQIYVNVTLTCFKLIQAAVKLIIRRINKNNDRDIDQNYLTISSLLKDFFSYFLLVAMETDLNEQSVKNMS